MKDKKYPYKDSCINKCKKCGKKPDLDKENGYFVICKCGKKTKKYSSDVGAMYDWNKFVNEEQL